MKTEELQALGLSEDQIKKVFELSGKDVNAEKRKTEKAETERDQWKDRAETAEETLKGFDGVDIEGLNRQIEDWKLKAAETEQNYQKQLYDRDFTDALKEAMEQYRFTSEAAKKAIMSEVRAEDLKLKDGKILGLSDLMEQIRIKDADAFAPDKDPARFTQPPTEPQSNPTGFSKMNLAEKMRYANEHPNSSDVLEWLKR